MKPVKYITIQDVVSREHRNVNDEIKCPVCGYYMKWWVTCWRCRSLTCRYEIPHKEKT